MLGRWHRSAPSWSGFVAPHRLCCRAPRSGAPTGSRSGAACAGRVERSPASARCAAVGIDGGWSRRPYAGAGRRLVAALKFRAARPRRARRGADRRPRPAGLLVATVVPVPAAPARARGAGSTRPGDRGRARGADRDGGRAVLRRRDRAPGRPPATGAPRRPPRLRAAAPAPPTGAARRRRDHDRRHPRLPAPRASRRRSGPVGAVGCGGRSRLSALRRRPGA